MTIESIIAAKVRLIQIDALAGAYLCVAFLVLSLGAVLYWWAARRRGKDGEHHWVALIAGCIVGFVTLCALGANIYAYQTADIQARADAANYRLVELKGAP